MSALSQMEREWVLMRCLVCSFRIAPPPVAMTWILRESKRSAMVFISAFRNFSSPYSVKISAVGRPAFSSMILSVSLKSSSRAVARARPNVVLPLPIMPIRTMDLVKRFMIC